MNFAAFDYTASDSTARNSNIVASVQSAITSDADSIVATAQAHGYGRGMGNRYYWGSNGVVARSVMNLMSAYHITANSKYLDAATQQVDYLLGRNPFGRSMVTGVGYAPPVYPHHRPSNADNASGVIAPWPGLLVGGPNKQCSGSNADPLCQTNSTVPVGSFWFDSASDYFVNEVAINWNGALVYALAGFVK
jgi:endoglucanase